MPTDILRQIFDLVLSPQIKAESLQEILEDYGSFLAEGSFPAPQAARAGRINKLLTSYFATIFLAEMYRKTRPEAAEQIIEKGAEIQAQLLTSLRILMDLRPL